MHTAHHMAPPDLHTFPRTVLIADRELPIRTGLRTILADEPGLIVPATASTITELTALAGQHPAALILMDTRFSDGDGIETCRTLLSQHHRLRVLFFTGTAPPHTILQAVDAGATGFLLKSIARTALLSNIRHMLTGQTAFDPILMSTALKWLGEQQRLTRAPLPQLSPRHQQILPLLSEGLTNKEIGVQLNLSEKTVKNYLADLFDRLHMTRRSQVAAWFIGQSVQSLPTANPSMMPEKIWGHTRPRTHSQEEPLHVHHSAYL